MNVATVKDSKRGCGWRSPGGLYLRADGPSLACGRLPVALTVCPCCSAGIKPTRGWTWVDGDALLAQTSCSLAPCGPCALAQTVGRVGLLWIGGAYYPTSVDWTREAMVQGVSRRIKAVPKGFVLGQTQVFVAHREVIAGVNADEKTAGVFHVFRPTAIEYVVKGDETEEQLAALVKRGISPVTVERVEEFALVAPKAPRRRLALVPAVQP